MKSWVLLEWRRRLYKADDVLCPQADLKELPLTVDTFGTRFDVVLIDPPWEEYARRATGSTEITVWPWQDVQALDVGAIADNPAFVFLWWAFS